MSHPPTASVFFSMYIFNSLNQNSSDYTKQTNVFFADEELASILGHSHIIV